jgi:hypothetical protein
LISTDSVRIKSSKKGIVDYRLAHGPQKKLGLVQIKILGLEGYSMIALNHDTGSGLKYSIIPKKIENEPIHGAFNINRATPKTTSITGTLRFATFQCLASIHGLHVKDQKVLW